MRPLYAGAVVLALLGSVGERAARAEEAPRRVPWWETKKGYAQVFATVMGGAGLRFNNPYRLSTPLGSDAESVSRTPAYLDLGLAATLFGDPLGFQHGPSLRTSIGVEGVGQVVFTPSYMLWRRKGALAAYGRAGIPVLLSPDVTWGFEGAVGGAFFFLGGIGVVAEVVGNVIYGTGTAEVATATYPILSGQLGLIGTYEVLP
ncbi:MAG: hypothetical protein KIT84_35245 [Labilithrix sp.]|nr:hypothetical protein [Labilithrix sp.]MCW5816307.1 hypothetical protein [Labilithrix sp.]